MLILCHWRYLKDDDSVLLVQVSEHNYDYLHPLQEEHVRIELFPSGVLMKATPNGTLIKFYGHVSIASSEPIETLIDIHCLLVTCCQLFCPCIGGFFRFLTIDSIYLRDICASRCNWSI